MVYSDPNRVRYWLSKISGARFVPKVPTSPPQLFVEPTNFCNLACVHCPHPQLSKKREHRRGFMDFNLYKRIIDEASQYKHVILRPFGFGEPLIDSRISQMIKYAKDKHIRNVWLTTNGALLSSDRSKELLSAGLDHLDVSIDAVTAETFSKIKGVREDVYHRVVENTINYSKIKRELFPNDYRKMLIVSFIESRISSSEKNKFIQFWKRYADLILIRPVHPHVNLVQDDLRIVRSENKPKSFPCPFLWRYTTIDYQGNVSFCDFDWEKKAVVGNVDKLTIREIWNSNEYNKIRQMHIDGRFNEVPLCGECKSYHVSDGCNRW